MARILLITILSIVSVYGCDNPQTAHDYVVVKSAPEQLDISNWRPVMNVTYQIKEKSVISEVGGQLDEYHDCEIKNNRNWQCQYEDGVGKNIFGFKDGKYFSAPGWGNEIKHVSRWEYNLIRCRWYRHDNGYLKGMASCLQTYI